MLQLDGILHYYTYRSGTRSLPPTSCNLKKISQLMVVSSNLSHALDNNGMLYTWLAKPRNRLFRRALAMRAILWVPVLVCVSMAT